MKVLNYCYYDDKGNSISKEELDRRFAEFKQAYESKYEQIVGCLVERINNSCKTNREKLKMLFDYLTNDNMKYDLVGVSIDGKRALHPGYEFPPYGSFFKIEQGTKFPAILFHRGVCGSYSKTFEDICKRLNIPCKVVYGYTGMEHGWNVVLENGELKHIDIAYAIMRRNSINKLNFFMKSFSELQQACGNRTMYQSENELIEELTPKIKVIHRTDVAESGFRVINRSDNNSKQIKVIHRTDQSGNSNSHSVPRR
jgi:hypothetical protein